MKNAGAATVEAASRRFVRLGRTGEAIMGAAIVAALAIWIYWPALAGGWVWDDALEIPLNPDLRAPLGWAKVWFNPAGPDYLPLKTTVQWIACHLWGQAPAGFHWLTLALHVTAALLLWRLLRRLKIPGAFLACLLFAVHPVAVESVAWIAELKNTLSLPLALLAFESIALQWAPVKRDGDLGTGEIESGKARGDHALHLRPASSWPRDLAANLWFVAALLCKTSVVMLPCVALLYVWWRRGRLERNDLKRAAPFASAAILGFVTIVFQNTRSLAAQAVRVGPLSRVAIAGHSAGFYLSKLLWPADLMPVYPQWKVDPPHAWQFLPWLGFAGAVVGLVRMRSAWSRALLFALGAVLLNLLPVLGFVPMAYQRISWVGDHLAYVALAAAMAAIGALWGWAYARWADRTARTALLAAAAAAVGAMAYASRHYAAAFRSDDALWSVALERNPRSWLAANNLGLDEEKAGRTEAARTHFEMALAARSEFPEAEVNWGDTWLKAGQVSRAIPAYRRAIDEKPDFPDAHARLALALARTGDWSGAAEQYGDASTLRPAEEDLHREWGNALGNSRRVNEAIVQYREALRLQPDDEAARASLGLALVETGDLDGAIAELKQALRGQPGAADAEEYLGYALAKSHRWDEAIASYREALKGDAGNPDLHYNLADALQAVGRMDEARAELARGQELERSRP
ncbi:MAG TPA: tetratricopeptide repeat protein [Opitutaceae bacterium]|jgi:tetratricopeptide (TPR) repeat protein